MNPDTFISIAKALADPMRLRVLDQIRRGGDITCSCVCDKLPLSQPTVSHHIRALERAGLISIRKDGQFNRLTVNQDVLDEFAAHIAAPRKPRRTARRPAPRSARR
jgi:ArsR family transcriptional regulator, arsenate/arsenite/antimonite-responsive transcriptional repressor